MDHHNLDGFIKELEVVESFVTELVARENELMPFGLSGVNKWTEFELATPVLKDFDRRLHEFLEFSRAVDASLHDSIAKIVEETSLSDALGKLYISLKIASGRRRVRHNLLLILASSLVSSRRSELFSEETVPGQRILVALHRLIPLARRVGDLYLTHWHHDDEIFKPSNIDKRLVINYIEQAIVSVQAIAIPPDQKHKLLAHLSQTKSELAEDNVSWKKVIGALIVAATLLSGLADAPQAFNNINKALQYILGTSVEKITPPSLPPFLPPPATHDGPIKLALPGVAGDAAR